MFNTFDTSQEKPLTMSELVHTLREKRQVERARQTLSVWIKVGRLRKSDKRMIQMDGMQIGGQLVSSLEAYDRFIEALNGEVE